MCIIKETAISRGNGETLWIYVIYGRAIAQAVSCRLTTEFETRSGNVGFVVDKVALEQVFSEYFGFQYHPGLVQ
jgi:hypothetical protein